MWFNRWGILSCTTTFHIASFWVLSCRSTYISGSQSLGMNIPVTRLGPPEWKPETESTLFRNNRPGLDRVRPERNCSCKAPGTRLPAESKERSRTSRWGRHLARGEISARTECRRLSLRIWERTLDERKSSKRGVFVFEAVGPVGRLGSCSRSGWRRSRWWSVCRRTNLTWLLLSPTFRRKWFAEWNCERGRRSGRSVWSRSRRRSGSARCSCGRGWGSASRSRRSSTGREFRWEWCCSGISRGSWGSSGDPRWAGCRSRSWWRFSRGWGPPAWRRTRSCGGGERSTCWSSSQGSGDWST